MPRRPWEAKTKALIILEGLKSKPVAEICTAQQSSQSRYDHWRDQFLGTAATPFDDPQRTRNEARLEQENARLKPLVGELTVELQKSDARLASRGNDRSEWFSMMRLCCHGFRR
jgi:hypothetical protein